MLRQSTSMPKSNLKFDRIVRRHRASPDIRSETQGLPDRLRSHSSTYRKRAKKPCRKVLPSLIRTFISTIAVALISIGASAGARDQIAAESKRANEFFDKCWDENLARHPAEESFYGIQSHYNQLEDLSDEKAVADNAVWQRQLATLKRDFKPELLDAETRLSYELFEREAEREAEEFKFRFDVYPISQRTCVHAQIPTFLINIHKIESLKDANADNAATRVDADVLKMVSQEGGGDCLYFEAMVAAQRAEDIGTANNRSLNPMSHA